MTDRALDGRCAYESWLAGAVEQNQWAYYPVPHDGEIEDWGAHLTLGAADFDFYGVDDSPLVDHRWIIPFLNNTSSDCASAAVLFGDVPSAEGLCGDNIKAMPNTTVVGTTWGQGCVIYEVRTPFPGKHCVTVRVPVPN